MSSLQKNCPRPDCVISQSNVVLWSPIRTSDIRWNFEKFLIDHTGQLYRRFPEETDPVALVNDIEHLMTTCRKELGIKRSAEDQLVEKYEKEAKHDKGLDIDDFDK